MSNDRDPALRKPSREMACGFGTFREAIEEGAPGGIAQRPPNVLKGRIAQDDM